MTEEAEVAASVAGATRYRLDRRHALRLLGLRMLVAAALVVVAGVLLGVAGSNRVLATLGTVVGVLAAVAVLAAVWVVARPPLVVRLAPDGYRVRRVPSCGVRAAPWSAVAGVRTGVGDLGRTMEVVLHDGSSTTVPLVLVAGEARAMMLDVRARLDAEHGYRRLPPPDVSPGSPGDAPT